MPEHRHEQPLGVRGIDRDARNLLPVAQPQVRPGATGIVRPIHTIAGAQIGALQPFSAAHVQDVGIRRRDFHRAHRPRVLRVENRVPRATGVVRFPNATVRRRHVEHIGLRRHTHRALRAARAERTDMSPARSLHCSAGKRGLRGYGPRGSDHRENGGQHGSRVQQNSGDAHGRLGKRGIGRRACH